MAITPVDLSVTNITPTSVRLNWVAVALNPLQALINSLFGSAEQGAFYIPMPVVLGAQSLFQDSEGTVPVTADGDPVGLMIDQSGNGYHAIQTVSAYRLIYRTDGTLNWLENSGTGQFIKTGDIDFTGTNKLTAVTGLRKENDENTGAVFEFGPEITSSDGSFLLLAPSNNGDNSYRAFSRGTVLRYTGTGPFAEPPDTAVISMLSDIAQPVLTLRRNGAVVESNTGSQGTGNYGNYALTIGARANEDQSLNGKIYSIVIRGAQTNSADLDSLEQYTARLAGVTL